MRAGDVVHVPANLNLMRSQPYLEGMSSMVVFETKMPKKALYLETWRVTMPIVS